MLHISYAALYQSAKTMAMTIERDLSDFQKAGIKQELFDQFKQKTEELILDSDQLFNMKKVQATDKKDQLDKQMRIELRQLLIIQSRVFTGTSGRMGATVGAVSGYSSSELIAAYVKTITSLKNQLGMLDEFGINEDYVANLENMLAQYSQALVDREKTIYTRDIAARKRQAMAQNLYADLSFFAQMGKAIYGGIDEAKYNDYILGFGTSSKTHEGKTEDQPEQIPPDENVPIEEMPDEGEQIELKQLNELKF